MRETVMSQQSVRQASAAVGVGWPRRYSAKNGPSGNAGLSGHRADRAR